MGETNTRKYINTELRYKVIGVRINQEPGSKITGWITTLLCNKYGVTGTLEIPFYSSFTEVNDALQTAGNPLVDRFLRGEVI